MSAELQNDIWTECECTGRAIKKTVSGVLRPQAYAVTEVPTKLCRHETLKYLLHREKEGKGNLASPERGEAVPLQENPAPRKRLVVVTHTSVADALRKIRFAAYGIIYTFKKSEQSDGVLAVAAVCSLFQKKAECGLN